MKPYFDTLFDTIQEREENGKAVLYQIEVEIATPEMVEEMLEMQNALMEAKMKSVPETVSVQDEHQPTVVSSTDGAKVLNNLDNLQKEYEEKSNASKTFIGDVAKAIGAKREKSNIKKKERAVGSLSFVLMVVTIPTRSLGPSAC